MKLEELQVDTHVAGIEPTGPVKVLYVKKALGALMKNYGNELAIPRPLDTAVEKAWGYASEVGRHLQEGREPSAEKAELVTTVCAAVMSYLVKKHDAGRRP